MARGRIMTEYQLERIKEHKYSVEGISLFDTFLQPFWIWLVEQIPETWAANSITLIGLLANVVSTTMLVIYCPKGYGMVPWWCYLLCGILLILYQTLDNIDGKQARRTKTSTPLGEFLDHDCDSLSTVLIIIGACISTQIGVHPLLFSLVNFTAMVLFFTAQWRTASTGVMKFALIDVTEGQTMVIILYMLNSKFGASFWSYELISGLKLNVILWLTFVVVGCVMFYSYLRAILIGAQGSPNKGNNKLMAEASSMTYHDLSNRSIIPSIFLPAVPLSIFAMLGFACCLFSRSHVMENNLVLYHFMFGTVVSKMSCLILLNYMTKTKMPCFDSIFLGPCFLLSVQYLGIKEEFLSLWIVLVFSVVNLLVYVYRVCNDICDQLDIYCFKITKLEKQL